jgi:glutathione S-transferase
MTHAILYSFRRCPYAMRARLAIAISGIQVELREITLQDKPQAMLDLSPKGTVPVLITADGTLLEESLDLMYWALRQSDPNLWLVTEPEQVALTRQLIQQNDGEFKHYLDRYKYADRYPGHDEAYYRQQAEKTLVQLEQYLTSTGCLISEHITLADMAILPFIRQFALVDKDWFDSTPYPQLKNWLENFLSSELFDSIMPKFSAWQEGDDILLFP